MTKILHRGPVALPFIAMLALIAAMLAAMFATASDASAASGQCPEGQKESLVWFDHDDDPATRYHSRYDCVTDNGPGEDTGVILTVPATGPCILGTAGCDILTHTLQVRKATGNDYYFPKLVPALQLLMTGPVAPANPYEHNLFAPFPEPTCTYGEVFGQLVALTCTFP